MMLSLPNMPGMTTASGAAATTSSGAGERGFNVAREEQVRGERLFFFSSVLSFCDHLR
jgi:hypothetical protein